LVVIAPVLVAAMPRRVIRGLVIGSAVIHFHPDLRMIWCRGQSDTGGRIDKADPSDRTEAKS